VRRRRHRLDRNGGHVVRSSSGSVNTYGSGAHSISRKASAAARPPPAYFDLGLQELPDLRCRPRLRLRAAAMAAMGAARHVDTAPTSSRWHGGTASSRRASSVVRRRRGSLGDDLPEFSTSRTSRAFAAPARQCGARHAYRHITTLGTRPTASFAQERRGHACRPGRLVYAAGGNILSSGAESNGIFAQSTGLGGREQQSPSISITWIAFVMGGTGTRCGGVRFRGLLRTLSTHFRHHHCEGNRRPPLSWRHRS